MPTQSKNTPSKLAAHFSHFKNPYIGGISFFTAIICIGLICFSFIVLSVSKTLPSEENIKSTELKIPLRVYSADKKLIAEFGDERRKPLSIEDTPKSLINAVLAGEDDRFFEHVGVDIFGIIRAALANARSGSTQQGASTITMQVARNYFLTREKTYTRKLREVLLAFKLETNLSKQEILQLYINKIFLGHRSYGFAAAAEVYFGKEVNELTLSEQAILAGLPKAPSRDNPIKNPERSKQRRDYVLRRMLEENWITQTQYDQATEEKIIANKHGRKVELEAPYVAEMVRSKLLAEFGEEVYWKGWHVYTSINSSSQKAASAALRNGLLSYDRRHGYRGKIDNIPLTDIEASPEKLLSILSQYQPSKEIIPAITLSSNNKIARLFTLNKKIIELDQSSIKWAKKQLSIESVGSTPKRIDKLIKSGDIIYVKRIDNGTAKDTTEKWELSQLPQIQGAIVSLEPKTGKIIALEGGFDFYFNKYNRATQARRQPGSGIKPFIYSAALEKGYSPASIISGAPIVTVDDASGTLWRPQNYSGEFFGPTSLRRALTKSMNTVSVRLLRSIEVDYAKKFLANFGLPSDKLPNSLSLALGAGNLTPIEVSRAYASLANSGYLIEPFIIEKIVDKQGATIFNKTAISLCDSCKPEDNTPNKAPRIISKESNFQIVNMMQDVVTSGTARKALALKRNDLAGKTGTTNDYVDAWFSGFTPSITTTVWVGFDKPQTMGRAESGGRAALPIWIDFMKEALKNHPQRNYPQPSGIFARQDPNTNKLEYFSTKSKPIATNQYSYESINPQQATTQINNNLPTRTQNQSAYPPLETGEQDLF